MAELLQPDSKETIETLNTETSMAPTWTNLKSQLQKSMGAAAFQAWIEPLVLKQLSDRDLVLIVPNLVFYQNLLDEYLEHFEHCKSELGLDELRVRFEIEGNEEENLVPIDSLVSELQVPEKNSVNLNSNPQPEQTPDVEKEKSKPQQNSSVVISQSRLNLNKGYLFETFVRGASNQFAHATCLAVASAPGQAYNPLFIYGSTGLGKTHLLHAVGNRVLQTNPQAVITYISSERFMNEMIYCLRFNKMWEFRQKYRFCDVFLVDDIQFISGKERTQEEFFHTFNTLYEAKKQIVMTSDLFPKDIPDIEDRLRNRFQWGLIADIQPPEIEHRIAILMSKAEQLRVHLDDEVALYIATHAKRNVRELEGALHRIVAFSTLHGRPINVDLAQETFKNILVEPTKMLTIDMIQKVVSEHFKIRVSDLKSKKRQRALSEPRQLAMYLCRKLTKSSFPDIGERFGGKDHTTVMHAFRKIEKDVEVDSDLKSLINSLSRVIDQQTH